jgi:3-keto-5-aminohexanoate cleavage enzyme
MVHYHARLADGSTSTKLADYQVIAEMIRGQGCDVILNASAGDDGGRASHEQRLAIAEVGLEMVSLDAGSFNIGNRLYDNNPAYLREMSRRMLANNVKPEIEVFSPGHLELVCAMAEEGLLKAPHYIQFVFGMAGMLPPDARLFPSLLDLLPSGTEWAVAVPGAKSHEDFLRLHMVAFTSGGHLRTGMEDYVYLRPGELAQTNAEMVEQWVQTARIWGRPIATADEARAILGIQSKS